MIDDDDFYEDDEPIEDIMRAWREGEHGFTYGTIPPPERTSSNAVTYYTRIEL